MQTSGTNPPLSDGVRKTIVAPVKLKPASKAKPMPKRGGKKC